MSTPISVFTGFLGAGKTTIILSLIKRLRDLKPNYNVVLLKNEFGDINIDGELAKESNVQVTEMMNGCLCCVLVGQMKNALLDIKENFKPDRIIIETSGSAFPAPIAWQIREIQHEGFILDAIVTVIDCMNFAGYEDTSYTAKLQAKYTDIILLNKHNLVSEKQLETVVDHVYELNDDPVLIKTDMDGIHPDLIFGIDSKQFLDLSDSVFIDPTHHVSEIDIISISQSQVDCDDKCTHIHYQGGEKKRLQKDTLEHFLNTVNRESVYRIKGLIELDKTIYILNWAFGRYTLTPSTSIESEEGMVKVSVMGVDLDIFVKRTAEGFGVPLNEVTLVKAMKKS